MLDYTHFSKHSTEVEVEAPTQAEVQRVLNVFKEAYEDSRIPDPEPEPIPEPNPIKPVVFLGHGHSGDWRKIKDHLQGKHGHIVEAYEVGSRAGHTVRDVLGSMMRASSIAFLVMTAEDEQADGTMRARQNVVHEAGLFQGFWAFPKRSLSWSSMWRFSPTWMVSIRFATPRATSRPPLAKSLL